MVSAMKSNSTVTFVELANAIFNQSMSVPVILPYRVSPRVIVCALVLLSPCSGIANARTQNHPWETGSPPTVT